VRVVATDAAAGARQFGVVRVHVLVTVCASFLGIGAHVVRSVTARTLGVRRHRGGRQHVNFGMARATGQRRLLAEVVRFVTAHALDVAAGKQGRLGHQRLLLGVARLAAGQGVHRWRVLMLVARGADLLGRFAECSVIGLDVAVTAGAGSRLGRGVLVNVVAAYAVGPAVHDHCGRGALRRRVTAHAVLRLEVGVRRDLAWLDLSGRKFVTVGAVRLRAVAETFRRLALGVANATLLLVAPGAARWNRGADGIALQLVTLRASELLRHHVELVTAGGASALPRCLHV
jgi:hypothetical protein